MNIITEKELIGLSKGLKFVSAKSHINYNYIEINKSIGDLLVLPKSFNASYGDAPYSVKVEHYFGQNILAQSLNSKKYINNPGFIRYVNVSGLAFKSYTEFKKDSISERANLYRNILEYNWK